MRTFKPLLVLIISLFAYHIQSLAQESRDYYQIKKYIISTDEQESTIDQYLKEAYLPAMHRLGVDNIGVFKTMEGAERAMYVLIPYKSAGDIFEVESKLDQDPAYLRSGKAYLDAPHNIPPYERIETMLLKAFVDHPVLKKTNLSDNRDKRVYELRSYESATEKIFQNKVEMFNAGDEIGIFTKLDFNAIFYGEVVAGCHMPNLMYMTAFEDMAARDAHWDAFGKDPDWKILSSRPEYQNNVSHADVIMLRATDYSDL